MKKLLISLLLILSIVLSLCGCTGENNHNNSNNTQNEHIDINDSIYKNNKVKELSHGCFNEYGYYCVSGSLIQFFDVESKQKIVLCNNPNCLHNSTECNAYISSKIDSNDGPSFIVEKSAVFVFCKGNRIYLLLTDGTMLSIRYDGTDHKIESIIDSKYSFEKGYLRGNEIIIYSNYSAQEQGEIVEKSCFLIYNIDTNNWSHGEAFDRNLTGDNIVGITSEGEAIFYHEDEIPKILSGVSINEATQITRNTKCQIYSLNVNTAKKKIIYNGTLGDCYPVTMLDGKIYCHSQAKEQLCTIDSQTGEIITIYENLSGEVFFDVALDDCLVIARTKVIEEDWNPENEVVEFFNVKTKELTEAYKLESNLDWNNNFRGILAETQDSYIMIYKAFFVVDDTNMDIPSVSDMTPYIGIISKNDFWNQKYSFEEISWSF